MANGDLYTVGTELQNILARRKAEAQQALLNEFKQKEFEQSQKESESRMKNDSIQAEAWKAQREAYAEAQMAQADERRAKILDQAPIDPGTVIDPGQFNPEDLEFARRTQRVRSQPAFVNPQGETDETVEAPRDVWQGNAEQRERAKRREAARSWIATSGITDPNIINQLMAITELGDGNLTESAITSAFRKPEGSGTEPFYKIDREGNPVKVADLPANAVFRQEPAPIRERARQPFQMPDGSWVWVGEGDAIPNGARRGNQPSTSGNRSRYISPATSRILGKLRADAAPVNRNPLWPGKTVPTQKVTAYREAALGALSEIDTSTVDPSVVNAVRNVILTGDERPSSEIIMDVIKKSGNNATPQELEDFRRLLYGIRGEIMVGLPVASHE